LAEYVEPIREMRNAFRVLAGKPESMRDIEQWYSTWGTRRHLRGYVKFKKKILFHDKHIN
jgi:hypothetical protein